VTEQSGHVTRVNQLIKDRTYNALEGVFIDIAEGDSILTGLDILAAVVATQNLK
jgi:hypothetical protein